MSFADNADKDNPALLKLYVPDSMVRVNSCVLNFEFEGFRAYEKGVASAQQNVATTSTSNQTTNATSTEQSTNQTSTYSGADIATTSTKAQDVPTTSAGGSSTPTSSGTTLDAQNVQDQSQGGYGAANHNHGISPGANVMIDNGNWVADADGKVHGGTFMSFAASGAHMHAAHTHTVAIGTHTHTITIGSHSHTVNINNHTHTVTIPSHSHTVDIPGHSHSVTIPAHTHDMQYGIYKSSSAQTGKLYVNGVYKLDVSPGTNIDLAGLLADAKTGKISRNTFHRIEIYPVATTSNTQGLTRIVANIFLQIFTNSRGSGDF